MLSLCRYRYLGHRDIKPANLLLSPDGHLSVTDFGLARMLEQPGMTMSGEFVGSPLYMSPEQITAGRAPLDHRTDINCGFGGILLVTILTDWSRVPGRIQATLKPPVQVLRFLGIYSYTIYLAHDAVFPTAGPILRLMRCRPEP